MSTLFDLDPFSAEPGVITVGVPTGTSSGTSSAGGSMWSPSDYDDNGLIFTIFLGFFLSAVFAVFLSLILSTSVLWVKRLYRPNHTVKPQTTATAGSNNNQNTSNNQEEFSANEREDLNHAEEPRELLQQTACKESSRDRQATPINLSILSPTVKMDVTAYAPTTRLRERVTRVKRLGVSLPFRSAFFQLPTFEDWINVEETSLAYVIGFDETQLMRGTSTTTASPPQGDETSHPGAPAQFATDTPDSGHRHRGGGSCRPPPLAAPCGEADALQPPGASPAHSYGTSEESSEADNERAAAEEAEVISLSGAPLPPQTPTPSPERIQGGFPQRISPVLQSVLPRTPLDPQISLYLFTLKYFVSLLFVGMLFTIWICPIANSDSYIIKYKTLRDSRLCSRHNSNPRSCASLAPYCSYNEDGSCVPMAIHGVYELTVQNIAPGSWLWWCVGFLNLGFCVAFVLFTMRYVKTVSAFVDKVMKVQMQQSLGYRVSCVRGLDSRLSEASFRRRYLAEDAYFTPRRGPSRRVSSPSERNQSTNYGPAEQGYQRPIHEQLSVATKNIIQRTAPEDSVNNIGDDDEEELVHVECCSIRCIYGTLECETYRTRRSDALFTRSDHVQQISFTRNPPTGIYEAMARAEHAKAALQNAVAQEKAMHRQILALRNSETAEIQPPSAIEATGDAGLVFADVEGDYELLMRKPFPSCYQKVPAVPYLEAKYRKAVQELNRVLDLVPGQRVAGSVFIFFSDARSAFEFVNLFNFKFSRSLHRTSAVIAGPASGVIPGNLLVDRFALYVRIVLLSLLFVVLLFFWSVPVGLLSSLDNIEAVPGLGPPIYSAYVTYLPPGLQNILTAYLPVAVLAIFNVALPYIIRWMVVAMGVFNEAERNGGQLNLQYLFMVLTAVIFQAALQGGLSELRNLVFGMNGEELQSFFVACVTPQGGYWYAKVIMATGLSAWLEVVDPFPLFMVFFGRSSAYVQRQYDALFQPCDFDYPKIYSFDLLILSIGLLFHMTVPLLTLFTLFYFLVRYVTMRQRLFERYRPTRRPAEDCTDFSVSAQVLRHVMGLFTLSEFCGVWLMHLRRHRGGQMLCALTCLMSVGLWIWMWRITRHWVPSLDRARRWDDSATATTTQPAAGEDAPTHSAPVFLMDEEEDCNDSNNNSNAAQEPLTVMEEPSSEETNPYSGHLLPRQKSQVARYHPKHQRLAHVDVDDEMQRMKATEFIVERYWDNAISWFETDHVEDDLLVVED